MAVMWVHRGGPSCELSRRSGAWLLGGREAPPSPLGRGGWPYVGVRSVVERAVGDAVEELLLVGLRELLVLSGELGQRLPGLLAEELHDLGDSAIGGLLFGGGGHIGVSFGWPIK